MIIIHQFLPEQETTITLYSRYISTTNVHTNIRCILRGCTWGESSVAIFERTGQAQLNNITIQIPYRKEVTGMQYVTPSEWLKLSVDEVKSNLYWTASPRLLNVQTFPQVVRGTSEHVFDWGTSAQLSTAESNFANVNPDVRRVKDINVFFDAYQDTRQNVEFTSDMRFMLLRAQLS